MYDYDCMYDFGYLLTECFFIYFGKLFTKVFKVRIMNLFKLVQLISFINIKL